ncbi:MAG: hypothetical protein Q9157_003097 [Trypethelium eluteriae]
MATKNTQPSGSFSGSETIPARSEDQSQSLPRQRRPERLEQYMEFDYVGPVNDPLVERSRASLQEDAKLFYRGFPDTQSGEPTFADLSALRHVVTEEMFVRGALLARRRQNLLDPLPGSRDTSSLSSQAEGSQDQENEESRLSQIEFDSLKAEEASRLKDQTKALNLVLLTCCVGAMVQGWSQASITGANLWWPCELLASGTTDSPPCQPSKKWAFNAVNAAAFFSACIGVWLSDFLNDMAYGRRGALMVAGTITFIASIWSGYTSTWIQLFGARFLLGIGYGAKASVVTIFESEVAPSKRRGRLLVSWQFFTATGLWLGTAANLIFHSNWRLQVSSSFIPCITFVALAWASSESPRWLIKKERYKEAFIVLRDLRGTDLQAARDLYFIYAQLRVEMLILAGEKDHSLADWRNYWAYRWALAKSRYTTRLQQIFSIPRNRRAALASTLVMASQ